MKISKLFHWLYAFLMFLPITFILPTLFYYGFNDNAISQEYTKEEPVYYESNEVTSNSDLIIGNIYEFEWIASASYVPTFTFECDYIVYIGGTKYSNTSTPSYSVPYFRNGGGNDAVVVYNDTEVYTVGGDIKLIFTLKNIVLADSNIYLNIHETNYSLVKEYQEVTYTMGITDSVNQSIVDTFDLPMFAWATNNILVAPFSSICSFFGIASTSVLIKYLYYWLTISVIWFVFDVLMYIPLLVHNYIDKARIE